MRYYWAGMAVTIAKDVVNCDHCLRKKASTRKPYGKPMPYRPSTVPFANVSWDKVTFVKDSEGYDQAVVYIDRATRYTHIIPCKSTWGSGELAAAIWHDVWSTHDLHGLQDSTLRLCLCPWLHA